MGPTDEKGISTPGVSGSEEEDTDDDVDSEGDGNIRYQGVIARCYFLAGDRPDCMFAIKEGFMEMSQPTTGALRRLRRIGNYLNM